MHELWSQNLPYRPLRELGSVVRASASIIVFWSLPLLVGCGPGGDFPTVPTTGRVICEGQTVPHVMVFFEPLQTGKAALVGKQGFAIAETDGTFSISTYGVNDGAVVGHHRVRVGPPHADDHPGFKCACVLNSEVDVMEVEIKKGQKNEFELALKKKTGREPKPLPND
jgi:hypothetical protein